MVSKLRGLRKLGVLKQDSQGKPARRAKMEAHLASPGNIPKKTLRSWELPNPPSYEKKTLELFNDGTIRGANQGTTDKDPQITSS